MRIQRASGVLLHPTSLPGPYGIGDIGPGAWAWIDYLASLGCSLWQVLPLGPTGFADSPYQCFSSFAGNPYLISPDLLITDGLLRPVDLQALPEFPNEKVDYGQVIPWKLALLGQAYQNFKTSARPALKQAFRKFRLKQADWIENYALFMALKEVHGGKAWSEWEAPWRDRRESAMLEARRQYAEDINRYVFNQFIFSRQWGQLRKHAAQRGVRIIGDIPIFVAPDSADVWAHTELFYLDDEGKPTVIAGVPPDYFSKTGQLWGNPLYRWEVHRQTGYAWWIRRIRAQLAMVDFLRIDHFRGFVGYWEVPAKAKTAQRGRWMPGPGKDFFNVLESEVADLPLIAEDLGVITAEVEDLRDSFGFPGMKILQFGFGFGPRDPFLPHNVTPHCVMYTGTHDNDTALGWYERVPENERDFCRRYLGRDGSDISWDMIRAVWSSVAAVAIAPMQDLLSLDNRARMNYPGDPSGNWQWRMQAQDMNEWVRSRMIEMNYLYARLPEQQAIIRKRRGI